MGSRSEMAIFRVPPYYYLHVIDQTTNITRVETGPKTFVRQDNEVVVVSPTQMITIPPRHYCVVSSPVARDEDGTILYEGDSQQVLLRHGEQEVRTAQTPFPLYPGETITTPVTKLAIVPADHALRVEAVLDCVDHDGIKRTAGDQWLFEGPGTYIPTVSAKVVEKITAQIVGPNQALRLRASKETTDREGKARVTGEEWLMKSTGAYLPGVYEEIVDLVDSYVLTEKNALHLRANESYVDDFGKAHKAGEEWLITQKDTEAYIPDVHETVVAIVDITTLTNRQYAVILDPVDEQGTPQLGAKKLVRGPSTFFLQPGECLEAGVQNIHVLGEDEGLILRAMQSFTDTSDPDDAVVRLPGDRWMIRGPTEYVPPVEVEVVQKRCAIPLDSNEGIYVRNTKTGKVRAVIGETYMLNQHEELFEKVLPPNVEQLISSQKDPLADRSDRGGRRNRGGDAEGSSSKPRDRTRVVSFRVPHNAAVQIYDFQSKTARVAFGPDLVMLGPDEHFTVLSLSGDKPKKPNCIKALCLLLGPDFCTDIIQIETSDHARLQLQLSYNWCFNVDKTNPDEAPKIFSVPDFVGDMCKAVASRVRGAVAQVQFDDFHKNSARIIRASVFGLDEDGKVRDSFTFPNNKLTITSIDIQSAEPVDQRTRDALQKSVQLAIEITTNSQEATARHEAERREQAAKGALERQKIDDQASAEEQKKKLLQLQAESAAVESTGQAKAEAQSRAEAARIEGEAAVAQAELKAKAVEIESQSDLSRLEAARISELDYMKKQNDLEIDKKRELMTLEVGRYEKMMAAIGRETVVAMARAGPDAQVKLLQSLGLKTTIITDGKTPINLLNAAAGLIGAGTTTSTADEDLLE
jgi:major vault protein